MGRVMKANGNGKTPLSSNVKKADKLQEPLRPLANLPVLRSTYCDQMTVDEVLTSICKRWPDQVVQLAHLETYALHARAALYLKVRDLVHQVKTASPGVAVPDSYLGQLDLMKELSRRLRHAYGLPELPPLGHALAEDIQGPYPPLPDIDIDGRTTDSGLSQSIVNTILQSAYKSRPISWFEVAESIRHSMTLLSASDHLRSEIQAGASSQVPTLTGEHVRLLEMEAIKRITVMCGLKKEPVQ
jgi:hypothetical protein